VAASLSARARQVLAGLLVLAVLALSGGQAVAAPMSNRSHPAHHDGARARATAVIAASGDFGSPCEHHNCTHCLACCIAGTCSMFSAGWLPADVVAPVPVASAPLTRPEAAAPAPDGLGITPAIPPPRRIV
jgi:hypothetical protein